MKKKFIAAILLTALLVTVLGVALAAPGNLNDPFVTLSYLTGTYYNEVQQDMLERAEQGTADIEKAAMDKLDALADSYLAQAGGGEQTDTMKRLVLARGDRLGLPVGASIQFEGGVCELVFASGKLIDVTTGKVLSAGGSLTAGHRYVAAEETACSIIAVSDAVYLSVRGRYVPDMTNPLITPFTDMLQEEWYHSYVAYAYQNGLFSGTSSTTFSPNTNMSRAMLATVLSRLDGRPIYSTSAGFPDIPDGQWFSDAVNWAANNGVVTGKENGTFGPNDNVTREQLCTMLYRYAKNYIGMDVSATGDLSSFSDQNKVSDYARDAVTWAVSNGIMTGTSNGVTVTLSPGGTATRSQVATMLQRFTTLTYRFN